MPQRFIHGPSLRRPGFLSWVYMALILLGACTNKMQEPEVRADGRPESLEQKKMTQEEFQERSLEIENLFEKVLRIQNFLILSFDNKLDEGSDIIEWLPQHLAATMFKASRGDLTFDVKAQQIIYNDSLDLPVDYQKILFPDLKIRVISNVDTTKRTIKDVRILFLSPLTEGNYLEISTSQIDENGSLQETKVMGSNYLELFKKRSFYPDPSCTIQARQMNCENIFLGFVGRRPLVAHFGLGKRKSLDFQIKEEQGPNYLALPQDLVPAVQLQPLSSW